MPSDPRPSHGALNQSMSDASLESAHDAAAKVFCDVNGRHLVQVGITDFFGDLLSSPYAVVFAIDHELISVSRAFRQHGFVDALDWNAKFCVMKFLLQNPTRRWVVFALSVRNSRSLGSHGTRLDSDQVGSDPGSEIRRINIVLAGDANEREQGVAASGLVGSI